MPFARDGTMLSSSGWRKDSITLSNSGNSSKTIPAMRERLLLVSDKFLHQRVKHKTKYRGAKRWKHEFPASPQPQVNTAISKTSSRCSIRQEPRHSREYRSLPVPGPYIAILCPPARRFEPALRAFLSANIGKVPNLLLFILIFVFDCCKIFYLVFI